MSITHINVVAQWFNGLNSLIPVITFFRMVYAVLLQLVSINNSSLGLIVQVAAIATFHLQQQQKKQKQQQQQK